ncbi:MAG: hypothetical protein LBF90_03165 [Prevotellaceae bacterium]|jgi:hypothetical protein|nr:hypothetical protein [Prevotellaceae bacterium]
MATTKKTTKKTTAKIKKTAQPTRQQVEAELLELLLKKTKLPKMEIIDSAERWFVASHLKLLTEKELQYYKKKGILL